MKRGQVGICDTIGRGGSIVGVEANGSTCRVQERFLLSGSRASIATWNGVLSNKWWDELALS